SVSQDVQVFQALTNDATTIIIIRSTKNLKRVTMDVQRYTTTEASAFISVMIFPNAQVCGSINQFAKTAYVAGIFYSTLYLGNAISLTRRQISLKKAGYTRTPQTSVCRVKG